MAKLNFKEGNENKHNMCVLAIFKNETMNLKVWIEHYLWQGVDKIYLIDNDSNDDPFTILQPYIDRGIVDYTFNPRKHAQPENYIDLINSKELKNNTKWLIICDLDEFFYGFPKILKETMNDFEEYDAIYSNWKMFGSCGLEKHPDDIRRAITCREPELNKHVKMIIKLQNININDISIHSIKNTIDTNDNSIVKYIVENDKIKLNHYPIQSLEFFTKVKMTRGAADSIHHENVRDMNYFNNYNKNTTFEDNELKNLIQ
jgi:hypothetical protein